MFIRLINIFNRHPYDFVILTRVPEGCSHAQPFYIFFVLNRVLYGLS